MNEAIRFILNEIEESGKEDSPDIQRVGYFLYVESTDNFLFFSKNMFGVYNTFRKDNPNRPYPPHTKPILLLPKGIFEDYHENLFKHQYTPTDTNIIKGSVSHVLGRGAMRITYTATHIPTLKKSLSKKLRQHLKQSFNLDWRMLDSIYKTQSMENLSTELYIKVI
jgi:hypothetical protein